MVGDPISRNFFCDLRVLGGSFSRGAGALARSGTGTLKIYFLSRFGAAILVNIRLNFALRSLSSAWARTDSHCVQSIQERNQKDFRSVA
jgi:hypothetical protein